MSEIADLLRYYAEVIEWGDWSNKYLWLLPDKIQLSAEIIGEWLAAILGY